VATYLVTGGCGFIGSHLADALGARGHAVRILDDLSTGRLENAPAAATVVRGDVADPAVVAAAMAGVDGCFHLAAIASVERGNRDWLGSHRVNLSASVAVFDAARRARPERAIPVVYASSAAVYGDNPALPLDEDAAPRPLSAYGADKLGCELHGRVAAAVHGVPTAGLRFFNVYGPRQDPRSPYSGVISIFCDRLRAGQPITIFGDGGQTRDFVYVGDVVAALAGVMARLERPAEPRPRGAAEVFNVCTGRGTTIAELAGLVARLCGVEPRIAPAPARAGEVRSSRGDPSRLVAALGIVAATPLARGLARTLGVAPELADPAPPPVVRRAG
jgi:UDP-glucose 4-epimerase